MVDNRFFPIVLKKTVSDISDKIGGVVVPKEMGCRIISGVNTLKEANSEDMSFLSNKKYVQDLVETKAGTVIVGNLHEDKIPSGVAGIVVKGNPLVAYALAAQYLYPEPIVDRSPDPISKKSKIGKDCVFGHYVVIEEGVEIGNNVVIGSNSYIGKGVIICDGCKIANNVHIEYSILGKGVVINSGACIGNSGFGIINIPPKPIFIPQLGRVIVSDFVRIGANSVIDRGSLGDTVIGEGTIIDNLVQIAHNVHIGKHCTIVSQVGIAGSCNIGNFVTLAGQVGLAGHLSVGDGVVVAAKSGVAKDIPAGKIMAGIPAVDAGLWRRQAAYLKNCLVNKGS